MATVATVATRAQTRREDEMWVAPPAVPSSAQVPAPIECAQLAEEVLLAALHGPTAELTLERPGTTATMTGSSTAGGHPVPQAHSSDLYWLPSVAGRRHICCGSTKFVCVMYASHLCLSCPACPVQSCLSLIASEEHGYSEGINRKKTTIPQPLFPSTTLSRLAAAAFPSIFCRTTTTARLQ